MTIIHFDFKTIVKSHHLGKTQSFTLSGFISSEENNYDSHKYTKMMLISVLSTQHQSFDIMLKLRSLSFVPKVNLHYGLYCADSSCGVLVADSTNWCQNIHFPDNTIISSFCGTSTINRWHHRGSGRAEGNMSFTSAQRSRFPISITPALCVINTKKQSVSW